MPEDNKQKILKAAVEFLRNGDEAESVAMLAKECGVSRATVYRLFPNGMDEVRGALAAEVLQSMVVAINADEARPSINSNTSLSFEQAVEFAHQRILTSLSQSEYALAIIASSDKRQIQDFAITLYDGCVLTEYLVRTIAIWGPDGSECLSIDDIKFVADRFSWAFFSECIFWWKSEREDKFVLPSEEYTELLQKLALAANISAESRRNYLALPKVFRLDEHEFRRPYIEY